MAVNQFIIHLQSATQYERIEGAISFVGRDASGSFGILAGHHRTMTSLLFGLAQVTTADGRRQFIALPGGLLYFVDNGLFLMTRRYIRDDDYARISVALDDQLRAEETALRDIKDSVRRLEEEMFKRLWKLGRSRDSYVWTTGRS
jgi:F-type H+-transporting ATPase subunit epsilon